MSTLHLKRYRLRAGLSQKELAEAVGVHPSAVCLWESGKIQPRPKTLLALATVLGCAVDDLLTAT